MLLVQEILEDADCEAVTASQAYDGLRLVDEGSFDAVFTDVGMPGMSGWELARDKKQERMKAGSPWSPKPTPPPCLLDRLLRTPVGDQSFLNQARYGN